MKRTNPLWISTLVVALPGLLYCGGSTDTGGGGTGGSGQATGAGGSLSTGSSTTGFTTATGTTTTTTTTTTTGMTTGAGGSAGSGGGSTTTGPGAGGKGGAGVGGAGMGGAMGGRGGAPVDAGACPGMQPMQGAACTSLMEVCDYPGFACTCTVAGMTRDGGMRDGWNCVRVRADAGGVDANACPRLPPVNRTACPTAGEVCDYTMETCTCTMGGGGDRWACARPDAGGD